MLPFVQVPTLGSGPSATWLAPSTSKTKFIPVVEMARFELASIVDVDERCLPRPTGRENENEPAPERRLD